MWGTAWGTVWGIDGELMGNCWGTVRSAVLCIFEVKSNSLAYKASSEANSLPVRCVCACAAARELLLLWNGASVTSPPYLLNALFVPNNALRGSPF